MDEKPPGLLAPSDIAEMARVTRAAVSNWRKRAADFPQPTAGAPNKPLFDPEQVMDWLRSRDIEPRSDRGERAVWAVLNEFRDRWTTEQMRDAVLTIACVRKLTGDADVGDPKAAWGRLLEATPGTEWSAVIDLAQSTDTSGTRWLQLNGPRALPSSAAPGVRRLLELFSDTEPADLARVVDYTLGRLAASNMRLAGAHGLVHSRTSRLLGHVAAARHEDPATSVLYDPACGIGAAMIEATNAGLPTSRLVGHDINPDAVRQASQRAYLHGLAFEGEVTNVLAEDPDPGLTADVIVLEPPFGMKWDGPALADPRWKYGLPPKASSELAWIQHALAHLSESGRAYVITPMGPLFRGGEEKAARAGLVRAGCVETIVALPGKLLPHTSIPLALWVLRAPREGNGERGVRLWDGTDVKDIETQAPTWCDASTEAPSEVPDTAPNRFVTVADLLAQDANLMPQRWIEDRGDAPVDVATAYFEGWRDMSRALDRVAGSSSSLRQVAGAPGARVLTVAELLDQGVLEFRAGKRYADLPPELQERIVRPSDIRDGALGLTPEETANQRKAYPELTRERDVLVTTMNEIRTIVDDHGGHLPSSGVYRLRVTDTDQLDPDFLARVLRGDWNQRFQAGTTIKRAPIKNLEVPVVPMAAQREFRLSLVAVELLQQNARDLLEHARVVENALMDALRYNVALDETTATD